MRDTEVIGVMRTLAEYADSDVLADDIRLLADSFDEYVENGAIDDEIEELESYYSSQNIESVRDAYEWVADQYDVSPASDKLSLSQFPWREEEANPAVWVSTELTRTKLPDAPDGWEWNMYDGGKQIYPNYLVKDE